MRNKAMQRTENKIRDHTDIQIKWENMDGETNSPDTDWKTRKA
jgi:hypothetical protein